MQLYHQLYILPATEITIEEERVQITYQNAHLSASNVVAKPLHTTTPQGHTTRI